jgi:hypothetical protein
MSSRPGRSKTPSKALVQGSSVTHRSKSPDLPRHWRDHASSSSYVRSVSRKPGSTKQNKPNRPGVRKSRSNGRPPLHPGKPIAASLVKRDTKFPAGIAFYPLPASAKVLALHGISP